MTVSDNVILNQQTIFNKLRRIAYQIYESNVAEQDIVLAGIAKNGFLLAKHLKVILAEISDMKIELCEVLIDKKKPRNPIKTSLPKTAYENKSLVLVDDVLHSGTTLVYGVKHFLDVPLKQFKTAVLVDRNHKKYPVKADYKGISLSTSIHEHVEVIIEDNNLSVMLV
jgi:pyrimidine operon attenuation protein / uracil phosphoribosyltransferase